MSEIGACFSEPPLRLEGSVHGQSEAPREDGVGAYAMATLCCPSAAAAGVARLPWAAREGGCGGGTM